MLPWTTTLSPNTTGWQYKTTRAAINFLINCPEAPVYLEDPMTMHFVSDVSEKNILTEEELQSIYDLLIEATLG